MIKSHSESFRFIDSEDCLDCENGMEVLDIIFKNIDSEPYDMEEWLTYEAGYHTGYGFYYTYNKEKKELLVTLEGCCQ